MKSLILYYSYTGNCKKQAMKLKEKDPEMDLCEVKDLKRVGKIRVFLSYCPKAALRKKAAIQDIIVDLESYEKIVIIVPIWNSYPAPQFNSIAEKIPANKEVELYLCSGGGESDKSKSGTCELIQKIGCRLEGYHDIQTAGVQF